jgi:hypothetical protein
MFRSINQRLSNETTRLSEPIIIDQNIQGIKKGVGYFSGNNLETTISHGLPYIPKYVNIIPLSNSQGTLGEIWARIDQTNIYVGNTGTSNCQFFWIVIK